MNEEHQRQVWLRVDGLDEEHVLRTPDFISISKLPYATWSFRFQLMKDGRDDLKGRNFDWWFEKLKEAAEHGAVRVVVQVQDRHQREREESTTSYTGHLITGEDKGPRVHPVNPYLFEFHLDRVRVDMTWNCYKAS